MDLSALEVLVAVARERSFSRAAAKLHRTQPAVSQAIRRLEEEVGARLVDRSSKDGTLTAAGALLLEHAERMLNLRRDAEGAIQGLRELRRGRVTLAANEFGTLLLVPVLAAFRRRHPEVVVEVRRSLARDIPAQVLGRDVELGVVTYRPAQPGLATLPIAADDLALVLAPTHPLARRAEVSISELGGEVFLAHGPPSPLRDKVTKAFERHRTPLRIVMELPTLEPIKQLVAAGLGAALIARRVVEGEVARGELAAVAVREMDFRRRVSLVHRAAAELSHAAAAFVDCAREAAGEDASPRRSVR